MIKKHWCDLTVLQIYDEVWTSRGFRLRHILQRTPEVGSAWGLAIFANPQGQATHIWLQHHQAFDKATSFDLTWVEAHVKFMESNIVRLSDLRKKWSF